MSTRRLLTLSLTLGLATIVVGCSHDDSDQATAGQDTKTTQAAAAASAPYGTYVRSVTKGDLDRTAKLRDEHGPAQELPPTGQYRLVIAKGASQDVMKATDPGGFTIAMDVSADPGLLRATSYVDPSVGAFCGPEVPAQAHYAYTASGSTLKLEARPADPCADRDSILTGTWRNG